jgi:alpha-beta hydrolase superfamily lysophospholipase
MSTRRSEPVVSVPSGRVSLEGLLEVPANAAGIVVFSHGSGSGRHSPRNQYVARHLHSAGLATLLLDLLTEQEDRDYQTRFDIDLLTERLGDAVRFVRSHATTRSLPVGLFGASTGAASALRVAVSRAGDVRAVVSRGGRPDLTGEHLLQRVQAATLLIVGGEDYGVIELNEAAHRLLRCEKEIAIVPGATHLFEEPGTLDEVARLATDWFLRHLPQESAAPARGSDTKRA